MKKYNLCLGGRAIERPTKARWLGNLPTGIHLSTKTSNTTYIIIHVQKGYKGYYSTRKILGCLITHFLINEERDAK